jgi:hypothetical protein
MTETQAVEVINSLHSIMIVLGFMAVLLIALTIHIIGEKR